MFEDEARSKRKPEAEYGRAKGEETDEFLVKLMESAAKERNLASQAPSEVYTEVSIPASVREKSGMVAETGAQVVGEAAAEKLAHHEAKMAKKGNLFEDER